MDFDHEAIKTNLSTFKFDGDRLWRIFTSPTFPEAEAKSWISDHFYLTIQVCFMQFRHPKSKYNI